MLKTIAAITPKPVIALFERLLAQPAKVIVPGGHGPHSTQVREDLQRTIDYLAELRQTMGAAAKEMTPFDDCLRRYRLVALWRIAAVQRRRTG